MTPKRFFILITCISIMLIVLSVIIAKAEPRIIYLNPPEDGVKHFSEAQEKELLRRFDLVQSLHDVAAKYPKAHVHVMSYNVDTGELVITAEPDSCEDFMEAYNALYKALNPRAQTITIKKGGWRIK
jgi:hypothetical protein